MKGGVFVSCIDLQSKKLKIKNFEKIIFIENGIDVFYVKNCNNKYILYHKNKKYNKKCYHIHHKYFSSLEEIFRYCKKHKNQYLKTKNLSKLNKIEFLLNNIKENENKNGRKKTKTSN